MEYVLRSLLVLLILGYTNIALAASPFKEAVTQPVGIVRLNVPPSSTPTSLYTVPPGKRLTITDIIVSPTGNNAGTVLFYRDATPVSAPAIFFTNTYEHSYVSGIIFTESQVLSVVQLVSGPVYIEIRGFLE